MKEGVDRPVGPFLIGRDSSGYPRGLARSDDRADRLTVPEDVANRAIIAFARALDRFLVRAGEHVLMLQHRPAALRHLVDPVELHATPPPRGTVPRPEFYQSFGTRQ